MDNTRMISGSNKKYYRLDFFLLVLSLACCVLILVGNPLKNDFFVSLGTRVMIIAQLLVVLVIDILIYGKDDLKKEQQLFLILAIVFFACAAFEIRVLLSKYVNFFCYLMLPMFMLSFYRFNNIKEAKIAVYVFNFILFFWYVYLYFSSLSHVFYGAYGETTIEELTLGYDNSNQTGMLLMVAFIIMLSCFKDCKPLILKAICLLCAAVLFYFTYLTDARTCIIIMTIFILLFFAGLLKKTNRVVIDIVFLLPFISFLIAIIFPSFLERLIILGEQADTGRSGMYTEYLSELNVFTFIFGDFANYGGGNLHNSYVGVFIAYGIIGFIAYIVFMRYMYVAFYEKIKKSNSSNYIAFAGALCIIVHGATESAFITAGVYYALLAGILFILCLPTEKKV